MSHQLRDAVPSMRVDPRCLGAAPVPTRRNRKDLVVRVRPERRTYPIHAEFVARLVRAMRFPGVELRARPAEVLVAVAGRAVPHPPGLRLGPDSPEGLL